jgi:hypothetical protein
MQEQLLVPGKGIRTAVVAPVTVAEEDKAGSIVKGDDFGRPERLAQPSVGKTVSVRPGETSAWQRQCA